MSFLTIVLVNTLLLPMYVLRFDILLLANHESEMIRSIRGAVFNTGKLGIAALLCVLVHALNAPHVRLHATAILATNFGVIMPLLVRRNF